MVEMRVLEYFLAVAELGTVTAAATRCYVSQPAISKQLAGLEQELGVKLFRRSNTGLQLNAAGERFCLIARDIRQRTVRGTNLMRSLGGESLALIAACPTTTMEYLLAPFIAEHGAPISDVRAVTPDSVHDLLERGSVDFIIGTSQPPSGFASRRIAKAGVMVQFPPAHPRFKHATPLEMTDLLGETLLMPGAGSAIGQVVSHAGADEGLPLVYNRSMSSSTVAQALAAAGNGCAIAVEPPQYGLHAGYLQVRGEALSIDLYAAWDPEHYAAPEIDGLTRQLADWAGGRFADLLASTAGP